jgi:hypothetical protein
VGLFSHRFAILKGLAQFLSHIATLCPTPNRLARTTAPAQSKIFPAGPRVGLQTTDLSGTAGTTGRGTTEAAAGVMSALLTIGGTRGIAVMKRASA